MVIDYGSNKLRKCEVSNLIIFNEYEKIYIIMTDSNLYVANAYKYYNICYNLWPNNKYGEKKFGNNNHKL